MLLPLPSNLALGANVGGKPVFSGWEETQHAKVLACSRYLSCGLGLPDASAGSWHHNGASSPEPWLEVRSGRLLAGWRARRQLRRVAPSALVTATFRTAVVRSFMTAQVNRWSGAAPKQTEGSPADGLPFHTASG